VLLYCWASGCGFKGRHRGALPDVPVAPEPLQTLDAYGRALFAEGSPVCALTTKLYLGARVCATPPRRGDLRYYEYLPHPSGYVGPALVARVTDVLTVEPISLHRTWVRADGQKADVDPPRMLLSGHRKKGGVIRLWPDDEVTDSLTVAEGIETALSVARVAPPAWSCIDAGNLAAFPVLPRIKSLLVVADHDAAGLRAAKECADRWTRAGRSVRVFVPPTPGTDANDLARAAG
jgi:hypothetical protein